jgi:protein-disulfide isomerase
VYPAAGSAWADFGPMASKPAPERRPSGLMVVLAFAIAIAAAVALVVLAVVLRTDDESAPPTATPGVDLAGIQQDGIVLGAPDARVKLIEYADLQCPACRAYTEEYFPEVVERYVRPGQVKNEFRGVAFIGLDSETALRYVLAAGLQNHLWELQEALYRNQGGKNSGWVTEELVRELAAEIPGLDADRLLADAESDEVTAMMEEAAAQANAAQIPGTPALAIQVGDDEPYLLASGISFAELTEALDAAPAS